MNITTLRRKLATVSRDHPNAIRQRVVDLLQQFTGTELVYASYVRNQASQPTRTGIVARASTLDLRDQFITEHEDTITANAAFDPTRPKHSHTTRFRRAVEILGPDYKEFPAWEKTYGQYGAEDFARILIYDGPLFAQYVGLSALDIRQLNATRTHQLIRLVDAVTSAMVWANRTDLGLLEQSPVFLFDARGNLTHASAAGAAWLDASRRSQLNSLIRAVDVRSDQAYEAFVDGAGCRVLRLDGASVTYAVTLSVSPADIVSRVPSSLLTERQAEIAELLAAGATIPEVAQWLELSPHTVKSHAKAIYKRLEVSSRVELARALEQ